MLNRRAKLLSRGYHAVLNKYPHPSFIKTNSIAVGDYLTAVRITHTNMHTFVNIPTTSKYYQDGLPNQVETCIKLAQTEDNLNEKVSIL